MLLKFCLATIGVCVFRCADFGWRTFYFKKYFIKEKHTMSEKVLVKGKFSNMNAFALICFTIAVVAFIACFVVATIFGGSPAWAFEGMDYGYYWFFIGIAIFVILGLIFASMKFELIVTEGKVIGKTLFGKRVDLPISQISVVGTGIFNRVSIATSSGAINFYGVTNQNEVFSVISEFLSSSLLSPESFNNIFLPSKSSSSIFIFFGTNNKPIDAIRISLK